MMWPVITENGDPDPEHEKYHPDNFPDAFIFQDELN